MFKFRLQRVLQWKEQQEQDKATRLAEAQTGRDAALQRVASLEGARDAGLHSAAHMQTLQPTVGQLQNLRMLVERMDDALEDAHQEADAADQQVRVSLAEFTTAFQQRKVLDRLRTKSLETWTAGEAEADRRLMDTVALNGFLRKQAAQAAQAAESAEEEEGGR